MQEKTDIPVVCAGKSTGGDLTLDEHRILGWIIGKEKKVEELIEFLDEKQAELESITSKIPENEKPKVYVAHMGPSREDILQVMIRYDPLDIAGGINVAKDCVGESATVISKEQIIDWNPDIILIGSSPGKEHRVSIEDVLSDSTLKTVNAVKNGRVYYTKGCMIGWDPATVTTEAFYFAKLFHPDKFKDLNVDKECNEILDKFYGVRNLYTEMVEKCELYNWK
jgi:iron complex transport system substrate-binding protein